MAVIEARCSVTILLLLAASVGAAVLPEDRADALYHYYDGGGVTVDGPSLLVRKKVRNDVSVYANYYVDSVSSASIDVIATASEYSEERTEISVGADYVTGDTIMSLSLGNSDENDYNADTLNLGIAQEFFGGLSTITLGYGRGSDEVRRNGDDQFAAELDRRNYRLGLSQVLSRNWLLSVNYEVITDEGFLNNPYRLVRFADSNNPVGYSFQAEVYPNTRSSNAVAVKMRYFLEPRSAIHGGYRFFTDDWGINAHTVEAGYTRPWGDRWLIEAGYRYYTQSAADFYSDLFPFVDAQNYLARDKELSNFISHTVKLGATWKVLENGWSFIDRGTVNLYYDHIMFDYDDFRDITAGGAAGQEPLYNFSADVIRLYFSAWF